MMARALFVIICMAAVTSYAKTKSTKLPTKGGTESYPAAAVLSFDVNGVTNCAVLFTGPCLVERGDLTGAPSNSVIATEIISLTLTGAVPGLGPVQLLAGSNLVGRASIGQMTATNTIFPADSYIDMFALIQLPGGTSLVNTNALRIRATVDDSPPISQIFTNIGVVSLFDETDTNVVVGTLNQVSFTPGERGKKCQLGLSADVVGVNNLGVLTMNVCVKSQTVAVATMKGQMFDGVVVPNLGCDELLDTNILFAANWDTNVRAPDWRGYHSGRFILYRRDSQGNTNLWAYGNMIGSNGVGTHRTPLSTDIESCDSCSHFEGQLNGKIIEHGTLSNAKIEATYAGEFLDGGGNPVSCCPPPPTPPQGAFRLTLDGIVISKCR